MKVTRTKIIGSGSTVEAYQYHDGALVFDFEVTSRNRERKRIMVVDEESAKKKIESRKRSMQRSKSNLRRLINSNVWRYRKDEGRSFLPVFVTFTFKPDIRDVQTANVVFSNFIKRFNYYLTDDSKSYLKYVGVVEFQDLTRKGVVHYHVIFFNLRKIMQYTLFELWGNGNIDIKKINHVDNIGAYMTKYMSKNFEDSRLDGQKRYFSSKGLLKPIEVRDEKEAKRLIELLPIKAIRKKKEFISPYHGNVTYTQYVLDRYESLLDFKSK